MKILCIINLVKYYEDELNKTISKLKNFEKIYEEISVFDAQMKIPFGIIFTENLDPLLNTENLRNSENFIDNTMESRRNIYASGSMDGSKLKNNNEIKKIKWNRMTQLLMMILIVSSIFTLLERSDFLNLFLSIIIAVLFILDKNSNIEKYLQPLILTIGGSLIYDFIWFLIQFGSFFTYWNDPEINLKRLIYFLSLGNFLIKVCLIKGLNDIKRKILYSSYNLNQ